MKKRRVMVLALIAMLSMGCIAYAAAPVTKEFTITTKDEGYKSYTIDDLGQEELDGVPREIKYEGRKCKAIKVTFNQTGQKKPIKRSRTYTGLTEKKVPKTLKLKSGKTLKLSDVKWTEKNRQAATGTMTFTGTDSRPSAPATKEITATLPDGSTMTVTGRLQDVKRTGSSYSEPFTVRATFTGDEDVAYYKLGNTKIPNNPATPAFDGYQTVLLSHLGLDADKYKITSGKWISDYTLLENGKTVRYAEFSGLRSTSDWTAYYTETVTADSPQLTTYDARAEYTNGIKDTTYEVTVSVTYEPYGLTLWQKIMIASAVIIIVAGLIAAILLILRKKRKKQTESSTV